MTNSDATERLLAEQEAYYRAVAPEYESLALPGWGGPEVAVALEAFRPAGDVLELACGPGMWTEILAQHATTVTAVDAAPEMLARAKARVDQEHVQFVHANLFSWTPDRQYDVVFFGFWPSHVPQDRFESFWSWISECLKPTGRVFFVDDAVRTPEELIEGECASTIQRRLLDGRSFRAIKVAYSPAYLEERLASMGWRFNVSQSTGPFYWGIGNRA